MKCPILAIQTHKSFASVGLGAVTGKIPVRLISYIFPKRLITDLGIEKEDKQ